ncbi:MAG: type II toxin-antitoxin system RelE/ParE family toxin [Bacteroidales bacterium]|nr:type II toxin-antitoxin system RelE/ParE family toxin [Bacteroidales bacterium]
MAKRKIIWSPEAKIEFIEILDFYYQRNGNTVFSKKLNQKIKKTISRLKTHPQLGLISNNKNFRVIIEGAYLIFYSITSTYIEILNISDSRQNPELLKYKK